MYNPNSVYQCMLKEDVLDMLSGGKVPVNVNTFGNDLSMIGSKDEALTALIHLGYLGYDAENEEAYIPNYEVALAYQAALSVGKWTGLLQCDPGTSIRKGLCEKHEYIIESVTL